MFKQRTYSEICQTYPCKTHVSLLSLLLFYMCPSADLEVSRVDSSCSESWTTQRLSAISSKCMFLNTVSKCSCLVERTLRFSRQNQHTSLLLRSYGHVFEGIIIETNYYLQGSIHFYGRFQGWVNSVISRGKHAILFKEFRVLKRMSCWFCFSLNPASKWNPAFSDGTFQF